MRAQYTVGAASENFHCMDSATNATVLEKARFTGGCVCVVCGDASRMRDKALANGKACDLSKKIDPVYLGVAHGDHTRHPNMDVRRMCSKSLKDAKTPNPQDPHAASLGDQCSEALHSAWQAEKKRGVNSMPRAGGIQVLNNMQTLYDTAWKSRFCCVWAGAQRDA